MKKFDIEVPAKWILAGEHSVLRGSEALVFPLNSKTFKLSYIEKNSDLEINIDGNNRQEIELIIWSVFERALRNLNLKRESLKGQINISSNIALGGGMGASATLCVAITELFAYLGFVPDSNKFIFARELENLFHGESSGVDVAVTLMKKPLVFKRESGFSDLIVNHKPNLYLSYSGERGVTKDCIQKVKKLFETNEPLAQSIDQQMIETVNTFKDLLRSESSPVNWIKNMKKANTCFEQWGLLTENTRLHQKQLLDHGALAVKLTGSGGGGYVLSLWDGKPASEKLPFEMISCFE